MMNNWMNNLSIKWKLTLTLSVLIITIAIFVLLYFPEQQRRISVSGIENKAIRLTEMMAFSSSASVEFDDVDSITNIFLGVKNDPDLVYAMVLKPDKSTFASYPPQNKTGAVFQENPAATTILYKEGILNVASPVRSAEGGLLGTVQLGFSLDRIHRTYIQSRNLTGGIITLVTVASLVIIMLLTRSITRPLNKITAAAKKIAAGDLSVDIIVEGKDEVGDLAQSFSTMVEGLRKVEAQQIKIAEQRIKMAQVTSMVENAAFNIMFADMDFKMIYMNPAATQTLKTLEHLLPCRVEEIIGKSLDIFHKDPDRIKKFLSNPQNLPHSALIKLGDETLDININAIYDDDENRIGSTVSWQLSTDKIKLLETLTETSESMALSSKELATSSQQMSTNSEEAKQQAGKVSTVSKETNHNVQTVAVSAEEMSVTINEISKNVHEATRIISQAVSKAESTNSTITKLGESGEKIGRVMKVINSIAQQINLLALNATIEAAGAGETGKGFAVVANEIKELAKETANATDEIRQQIEEIQTDTKEAVAAIQDISKIIGKIDDIATTIAGSIEEQTVTTTEITKNIAEAAQGTNDVVENAEGIASASKKAAEGALNVLTASQKLSKLAGELRVLVRNQTI